MCKVEDILCKGANARAAKAEVRANRLKELNNAMEAVLKFKDDRIRELEDKWAITPQGPPPYIPFTIKDDRWVLQELVKVKNSYMGEGLRIWPLLDSSYKILTPEAFIAMAKWLWVDQMDYVADFFDCDDFADVFSAMAIRYYEVRVGVVYDWSGGHAYNIAVLSNGARIWEPQQSGGFASWTNRPDMYRLEEGELLH